MTARARVPIVVLLIGFSFSLAANLLWTWPGGPVRILGGAFASIALPAAVHMWPTVPANDWLSRWIRNLVMLAIAGLAAATTFSHASSLLMMHGELPWLSQAYPVMTELLVVFAVLARRAQPARKPVVKPAAKPKPVVAPKPAPPQAPPSEIESHRGQRQVIVEWVSSQDTLPTPKVIQTRWNVSRSTATRVLADVRSA